MSLIKAYLGKPGSREKPQIGFYEIDRVRQASSSTARRRLKNSFSAK